ncbi:MAG: hypothetical protein SXA11_06865 [Cyanobacteriota bacterium]|nr:hypothetical protein [Cyanobacteriota bacterium]
MVIESAKSRQLESQIQESETRLVVVVPCAQSISVPVRVPVRVPVPVPGPVSVRVPVSVRGRSLYFLVAGLVYYSIGKVERLPLRLPQDRSFLLLFSVS